METIGISPRFFKHELNNYSEWEKAFWRELVQNSVDENCSRIEITIHQVDPDREEEKIEELQSLADGASASGADPSKFLAELQPAKAAYEKIKALHEDPSQICTITFSDNGPGMNEDTMRNIYFQLGATGKEGADTIGGHGRARILTCFAHDSYEIRTQNLLCKGQGGSFSVENNHPFLKGCIVSVALSESTASRMEYALRQYLETCQLPCSVTINKEGFSNWLYRRKATRVLSFGSVHTTKQREYCAIARVRGVAMFTRYIACKTSAILEIDPQKSREILTVSRDQMKHDAQHELNTFITEITIDNKSLSRDCSLNKTEIFGKFKTIGKRRDNAEEKTEEQPKASMAGTSEVLWHGGFAAAAYCTGELALAPEAPFPYEYSVHYEDAPKHLNASARRFHKEAISGNRLKLLLAWDETLQFFLETLHDIFGEEIRYLPGFVFGNSIGGMCKTQKEEENEGHILYINPLDTDGKINLSCQDYARLYSIGAHEVAHIRSQYHNEEYASVLTQINERTVDRMGELKSQIRKAVATLKTQKEN